MSELAEFDRAIAGINRTRDPGDGGTVRVIRTPAYVPLKTIASETRILAAPSAPGLHVQLNLVTDGGDCGVTVTRGFDQDGSSVLVPDDAGDCVVLESTQTGEDTAEWRLVGFNGVAGTRLGVDYVMCPVDSATVIEVGDFIWMDTDDAKPASVQSDQGTEAANQELFHDNFLGMALRAWASGETDLETT